MRLPSTDVHDTLNTWSPESFSCRAALSVARSFSIESRSVMTASRVQRKLT